MKTAHPSVTPQYNTFDHDTARIYQFVFPTLGNAGYIVIDTHSSKAISIDVPRDADYVVDVLQSQSLELVACCDTHIHNDFVSGGETLSTSTNQHARYHLPHPLRDASIPSPSAVLETPIATIGQLSLYSLPTPGHTPEHVSYLLSDKEQSPLAIFSGGALMVGTIARPDLLGPQHVLQLSTAAKDTISLVYATLPDSLPVYATHGSGSFCGTGATGQHQTTIGAERIGNPLFAAQSWDDFVSLHTHQKEYPTYFHHMAETNLNHPHDSTHLPSLDEVELAAIYEGMEDPQVWIIDLRSPQAFGAGHIPHAINVGYGTSCASWIGWVVPWNATYLLIADEEETCTTAWRDLYRIGYDDCLGWFPASEWVASTTATHTLPSSQMAAIASEMQDRSPLLLIDVRMEWEWNAGHLPGAMHHLPHELLEATADIDPSTRAVVYCQSGYRASLGASLLQRAGWTDVTLLVDSVPEWVEAGHRAVVESS